MSNLCILFPFLFVNMYMENGKCWSLFTSSQNETKVINKFLIRVESKTRKKELHDFDSNSNNRCCSILFIKKTFYSERQETLFARGSARKLLVAKSSSLGIRGLARSLHPGTLLRSCTRCTTHSSPPLVATSTLLHPFYLSLAFLIRLITPPRKSLGGTRSNLFFFFRSTSPSLLAATPCWQIIFPFVSFEFKTPRIRNDRKRGRMRREKGIWEMRI